MTPKDGEPRVGFVTIDLVSNASKAPLAIGHTELSASISVETEMCKCDSVRCREKPLWNVRSGSQHTGFGTRGRVVMSDRVEKDHSERHKGNSVEKGVKKRAC